MSETRNGPWRVHATRTDFANPWLEVETSDITHPDGSAGTYGVVRFANLATGVLPIGDDGMTWLVGQHRFPLNDYSWELPEGGGKKAQNPWASASRELAEETGLVAEQHALLGKWHLSNSVTDEVAFGFLAWGLREGAPSPDPSEALEVRKVPFSGLVAMLRDGNITDAFTALMVWSAIDKARSGAFPDHIRRIIVTA